MATGQDLVRAVLQLFHDYFPLGLHYENTSERRCHPDVSPYEVDCSGLLCWAQNKVGVPYPCTNSWEMAKQGHREGLTLLEEVAMHTPGAWLVQGANEGQTNIGN